MYSHPIYYWTATLWIGGLAIAALGGCRQDVDSDGIVGPNQSVQPPGPTPLPSGKDWVAYAGMQNGNWDIYVTQGAGQPQYRLTSNPLADYDPVWSPNGEKIAFTRDFGGGAGFGNIYVVNPNGTGETSLTTDLGDDNDLAWSPDGSRIAFTHEESNDGESLQAARVYVMNADGSDRHPVNPRIVGKSPSWSPNGQRLAFVRNLTTISAMNLDGTGVVNLDQPPAGDWDRDPHWSPDGTRIVSQQHQARPSTDMIVVMNADGTNKIGLTTEPYSFYDFAPRWSPNSEKISWTSGLPRHIWTSFADGFNPTQLTDGPDDDGYPYGAAEWTPDGKHLVFARKFAGGGANLFSITSDSNDLTQLTVIPSDAPAVRP
jgi:Tol biopolymer transport system component